MPATDRTVGALLRPAFVALVAPIVLVESLGRAVLAVRFAPIVAIFAPPVLGAILFVQFRPTLSAALEGQPVEWDDLRSGTLGRSVVVGFASVVVHAIAMAFGFALFVLIDTPVRYLWYSIGGDPLSIETMTRIGIGGVLAGVVVGWSTLAVALVRIGDGESIASAIWDVSWTRVARPKPTLVVAGVHLLAVGAVAVAAWFLVLVNTRWVGWALLAVLVASVIVDAAALIAFQLDRVDRPLETQSPTPRTLLRVAVAVALVTSLVAGASAVRLTETRPIDAEPEPLPDDPTAAYAVALENTERTSVSIHVDDRHGSQVYDTIRWDRENRRLLFTFDESLPAPEWAYRSAGTAAPETTRSAGLSFGRWASSPGPFEHRSVVAIPGYWKAGGGTIVSTTLPNPETGEWRVVDRTGDEFTVELTDDDAVIEAVLHGTSSDCDTEAAHVRATVDRDSGVVTHSSQRLEIDASDEECELGDLDIDTAFELETGVTLERPAELGRPTGAEWLWKLFAY